MNHNKSIPIIIFAPCTDKPKDKWPTFRNSATSRQKCAISFFVALKISLRKSLNVLKLQSTYKYVVIKMKRKNSLPRDYETLSKAVDIIIAEMKFNTYHLK